MRSLNFFWHRQDIPDFFKKVNNGKIIAFIFSILNPKCVAKWLCDFLVKLLCLPKPQFQIWYTENRRCYTQVGMGIQWDNECGNPLKTEMILFFFFKIYVFIRDRESTKWGRDRGERISIRLHAQPPLRAQSHDSEIMTWPEIRSQTLNRLSHPGALEVTLLKNNL